MKRFALLALCLIVVAAPARGQTADEKKATIAYLQKLQNKDGGFLPAAGQDKSSLRATTTALRALKYFGGQPKDKDACVGFVLSCFDKVHGGFADTFEGSADVISTAIGILALTEVKRPSAIDEATLVNYLGEHAKTFEEIRLAAAALEITIKKPPQVGKWLDQIATMRNPDSTYGKGDGVARATGGAVAAVLRLGGKVEHQDNILKALKAGQRNDGGFGKEDAKGSDLESTYRIVRAFFMLKDKPDVDKLRGFIAKCRNDDGGYGVEPGKPSSASGTYYAGIVLHWLEEK